MQRNTSVIISIETFPGKRRIFQTEEIIKAKLPMTLDTAHIHDNNRIIKIIDNYWQSIPVVHLSARGRNEHHLPVDRFCIQVVRKLVSLGWLGTIILEYLPWHHYRLKSDIEIVKQALIRDIRPDEIPPPCDAYKGRPGMWSHNTPEPEVTTSELTKEIETHKQLEMLYNYILTKNEEILDRLRTDSPSFEYLTEGEQAIKYTACAGRTTLAPLLHKARKGTLTLKYLQKKLKQPNKLTELMKRVNLCKLEQNREE